MAKITRSELSELISERLNLPETTVHSVLVSLNKCSSYLVTRGFSFNLSENIRLRIKNSSRRCLVPRTYFTEMVALDSGCTKHVTSSVITEVSNQVLNSLEKAKPLVVSGLLSVRVSPEGTATVAKSDSLNRVVVEKGLRWKLIVKDNQKISR